MVKIKLPAPQDFLENPKHFFRQLELAVHYAQKTYEQMEKDGIVTDDTYIAYRFPSLDLYGRKQDNEGFVKVHVDEEIEIELEIA